MAMEITRTAVVVTASAAGVVGALVPDVDEHVSALRGDNFPAAVLALVTLTLLLVSGWVLLVATTALVPASRRLAVLLTPRLFRGVLLAGTAAAIAAGPAHADGADRGLGGLRLPDRPAVAAAPEPASTSSSPEIVVVRPGDTLWSIAAGRLGPGADVAATARACHRWYAANRDVIGPDPDLIHPGQQLTPPPKDHR